MEALLAGVDKALRDVDGANALLVQVADEVAAETRAAEADVRAVTTTTTGAFAADAAAAVVVGGEKEVVVGNGGGGR